jgi:hypothetical protein
MEAIPRQLAAGLTPGSIELDTPVVEVGNGVVTTGPGRRVEARRIVVATEGPAAARLLGLAEVGSRPASCVWFSAPAPPIPDRLIVLDGTGDGPARNVVVMSNVNPACAPAGRALIAAACPGVLAADLEPAVRAQLRRWWGPQVDRWDHLRSDAIAHGQPDHRPPFDPKRSVSRGGGVFVCGDHRDTPSIQGALHSGRRCGLAVLDSLT